MPSKEKKPQSSVLEELYTRICAELEIPIDQDRTLPIRKTKELGVVGTPELLVGTQVTYTQEYRGLSLSTSSIAPSTPEYYGEVETSSNAEITVVLSRRSMRRLDGNFNATNSESEDPTAYIPVNVLNSQLHLKDPQVIRIATLFYRPRFFAGGGYSIYYELEPRIQLAHEIQISGNERKRGRILIDGTLSYAEVTFSSNQRRSQLQRLERTLKSIKEFEQRDNPTKET